MPTIVNTVTIDGPIEAVFDLATTARLWPEWHPATRAVGGVTERPYLIGDVVHERGEVADVPFQATWTVTEHVRPSRMTIRTESPPIRIIYTFEPRGGSVEFRRELEYDDATAFRAVAIAPDVLEAVLHAQSGEALRRLKQRIEAVLRAEVEPFA